MLTLLYDGLRVQLNERRAEGRFRFDALTDLPAKGAAVDWVKLGDDTAIGGGWHADAVALEPGPANVCRIIARQPGYNWTWVGLAPLEERNFYTLVPASKVVNGTLQLGYWHVFGNWNDTWNWTVAQPNPLTASLKTWELEFVAASSYQGWVHKVNGAWPSGITPPVAGSGVYWCRVLEITAEPWTDPVSGVKTDYYRHFAVLREAPALSGTQLTWVFPAWG